jgi:GDPmannose 4,6-dehydratase
LRLGNIDIERDWGWAPDYVEAMYRMLQQDQAEDYVIATGASCRLQDFLATAFNEVGLDWQDHVVVDKSLYRPTEIMKGRANPQKAEEKLGWRARWRTGDIVREMIAARL